MVPLRDDPAISLPASGGTHPGCYFLAEMPADPGPWAVAMFRGVLVATSKSSGRMWTLDVSLDLKSAAWVEVEP